MVGYYPNLRKTLEISKKNLELKRDLYYARRQEIRRTLNDHPNWKEDARKPYEIEDRIIEIKIKEVIAALLNNEKHLQNAVDYPPFIYDYSGN